MAQVYVVTGVSLAGREPRTLRVRAADERAAGWAAIERGIEVRTIEPDGGRPAPSPPVAPDHATDIPAAAPVEPPPRRSRLSRASGSVLLAILLAGAAATAYALRTLPADLRELQKVQDWYERALASLPPPTPWQKVPPNAVEQLRRMRNTRNLFLMPVLWEGAITVIGLVCVGVTSYEFLCRLGARPPEARGPDAPR